MRLKIISIFLGFIVGLALPTILVLLDLLQLQMQFNLQNVLEIYNSQLIFKVSFIMFPLLFMTIAYQFFKTISQGEEINKQKLIITNVFNSVNEGIAVINSAGEIQLSNNKHNEFFEGDHEAFLNMIKHFYQEDTQIKEVNANFNGQEKVITFSTASLVNKKSGKGLDSSYVISYRDITDKKHMEKSMLLNAKLASIGEMAGGVAHEINNPLAIISLNNHSLKKIIEKNNLMGPRSEKFLNNISSMVERISVIVETLKTISVSERKLELSEESVKTFVDHIITITSERFKDAQTTFKVIDNQNVVGSNFLCDKPSLSQVLIGLLYNSIDAISDLPNKWVHLEIDQNQEFMYFKIVDAGSGIAPEVAEKIFQPFFSTKDIGSGTGTGLSMARSLVEHQGGELSLDDNAQNTTFVIKLPLKRAEDRVKAAS